MCVRGANPPSGPVKSISGGFQAPTSAEPPPLTWKLEKRNPPLAGQIPEYAPDVYIILWTGHLKHK